jgi:hypothetical protein
VAHAASAQHAALHSHSLSRSRPRERAAFEAGPRRCLFKIAELGATIPACFKAMRSAPASTQGRARAARPLYGIPHQRAEYGRGRSIMSKGRSSRLSNRWPHVPGCAEEQLSRSRSRGCEPRCRRYSSMGAS